MSINWSGWLPNLFRRLFRLAAFTDKTAAVKASLPAEQRDAVTDVGVASSESAGIAGKFTGWVYVAEVTDPDHPPADLAEAVQENLN